MVVPVFIVNWNGWKDTIECMDALLQSTFKDFHIYLLENGSSGDDYIELEKRYSNQSQVTLIESKVNLGFTGANNYLLEYVLSDLKEVPKYLALLNNDAVPDVSWLESLIYSAEANEVDMVSSKMIQYYDRNKMDNAGHYLFLTGTILPIGYGKSIHQYNKSFFNKGPCAGGGLYSIKMILHIGFFDPYFTTGYEDAELGWRAVLNGYKSMFNPFAIVYHKGGQSLKKTNQNKRWIETQHNIIYTYYKLSTPRIKLYTLPFFMAKGIIVTLLLAFKGNYKAAINYLKKVFAG